MREVASLAVSGLAIALDHVTGPAEPHIMGDHHDVPGDGLAHCAAPLLARSVEHFNLRPVIEEQALEGRQPLRRHTVLAEEFGSQIRDAVIREQQRQRFRRRILAFRPIGHALGAELLADGTITQELDLRPGVGGGEISFLQSLEAHLVGLGAEFRPGLLLRVGR